MAMTITEKILAKHAGRSSAHPGQTVWCDVDVLMTHDICGPASIGIFEEEFGRDAKVWDADKVVIMPDHYIFTADEKAHRNVEILREFARRQNLKHYYDPDFMPAGDNRIPKPYVDWKKTRYAGVCHAALAEKGYTVPGGLLLGTDSHTCTAGAFGMFATGVGNTDAAFVLGTGKLWLRVPESMKFTFHGHMPEYLLAKDLILHVIGQIGVEGATYRAMEFRGEALAGLDMDQRRTLPNMAIEAGGKSGILEADDVTTAYFTARSKTPYEIVKSDAGAKYCAEYEYDTTKLEPTVACPHSPGNRAPAKDLGDRPLHRAYIGSCTGGSTSDLRAAAKILVGRRVKIDTYIVPATPAIDHSMDVETVCGKTLRRIFLDAGCHIGPASCAACLGGPPDTFGRANTPISVISATNRNFPGRMGHKSAQVYLASPLTVAASAAAGKIADPRDFLG
jgi:3-isopropylmalate/(R)-2-methylmalate dehydratase large subunit